MPSRRVLLAMIEPPLPFGNAAGRWFHVLLRGLVERGHDVAAFATYHNPADAEKARGLFPDSTYDLRLFPESTGSGLASKWRSLRRPYSYLFSPEMRAEWDREARRGFDVVHLEQLWSGRLGLAQAAKAVLHLHYLFAIDLDGVEGGTVAERFRRRASLRAERELLRSFPRVTALTDRLADLARGMNPWAEISTIPLGMDATLYPFPPPEVDRPPTVALIGSFGWRPTRTAAERLLTRLWPVIRLKEPEARLLLVGRNARAVVGPLAKGREIEIHEDVPDTLPYFQASDVMLYAPARGSGMKVKVLEAFALGTPVATTSEGVEGLPAVDGVHAAISDTDEGLIRRTIALLRDRDLRDSTRRAARRLVEIHCGPERTLDMVEAVHERAAGGRLRTE